MECALNVSIKLEKIVMLFHLIVITFHTLGEGNEKNLLLVLNSLVFAIAMFFCCFLQNKIIRNLKTSNQARGEKERENHSIIR